VGSVQLMITVVLSPGYTSLTLNYLIFSYTLITELICNHFVTNLRTTKLYIMKKNLQNQLSFIVSVAMLFFIVTIVNASEYTLTFSGTGASTSIDKVVVQNLTKETTQTVYSGSTFQLTFVTTASNQTTKDDNALSIYPNPMNETSRLSFYAAETGKVQISVSGIDGISFTSINRLCDRGENSFRLSLPQGVYVLTVHGNGFVYTAKVLSENRSQVSSEIAFLETNPVQKNVSKVKQDVVSMVYSPGDHLLFTAYSGNYSNIVTDFNIMDNKNIPFVFDACADGSGFNYCTVKIGGQTWMAEDLKTMKYRNGENITEVYDNWELATTGAYCYNTYAFGGKLYNHLAVSDNRNIAPTGWHIPTNNEWGTLTTYLGGEDLAGSKMKSTNWHLWTTANYDATNESGFNALPGGSRHYVDFTGLNTNATWWSSTQYIPDPTQAWYVNVYCQTTKAFNYYASKIYGLSVRCVKD